jgi:hypothetical protein
LKLAIAYSTKDQVELSKQTFPVLRDGQHALFWCDGSTTDEGRAFVSANARYVSYYDVDVTGGADAAIAWKLTKMLEAKQNFTHIGLLENDVLLDPDWLAPTLELFEKGKADGLDVGAVSPRSYVDRVLIQRDGYAVMHNIGAGAIIFTREAAELVLRTFRTAWWQDNVWLFANLSGIDLRTYAAFRGNEQWTTTDWSWEAQIARHGMASLALTPARCTMVGQVPPLAEQGLELVPWTDAKHHLAAARNEPAFIQYRNTLMYIRSGDWQLPQGLLHRDGAGMLFFPHQIGNLPGASWQGTTELKWCQGFGPFAYVAGPGGASLSARISGISQFLCAGGSAGARVTITDTRSGFRTSPDFPAGDQPIAMQVPGGPIPREVTMDLAEGAVFYGLQTADPQMIDTTFRFDWNQLPRAK